LAAAGYRNLYLNEKLSAALPHFRSGHGRQRGSLASGTLQILRNRSTPSDQGLEPVASGSPIRGNRTGCT